MWPVSEHVKQALRDYVPPPRCGRHPRYLLASCETCMAYQRTVLAQR